MYKLFSIFCIVACALSFAKPLDKEKEATLHALNQLIHAYGEEIHIGLEVSSLKSGETLYQHKAHHRFVPASSLKIITALAALEILGPDFQFSTELWKDKEDLYLKASGDPSLKLKDFYQMALELKREELPTIKGNLILDETVFDPLLKGPGWMWDEGAFAYNPLITSLILNRNCIDVWIKPARFSALCPIVFTEPKTSFVTFDNQAITSNQKNSFSIERRWSTQENIIEIRGSISLDSPMTKQTVSLEKPDFFAGHLLIDCLKENEIFAGEEVLSGKIPVSASLLYTHHSKPLAMLLYPLLKKSDNLFAECLFKTIGKEIYGAPGSWQKGANAVRSFLETHLRFKREDLSILDGSGLSRYNLISPHQLTELLKWAHHSFLFGHVFKAALPMNGVDGTLKNRLVTKELKGRVKAKTGAMSGVSTLAGYITTLRGEELAFTLMINGCVENSKKMKEIEDKICEILINYKN